MSSESRSAGVIVDDAVARTGWDFGSVADVLIEYIENQGDNSTFADFIAEKVAFEEQLQ